VERLLIEIYLLLYQMLSSTCRVRLIGAFKAFLEQVVDEIDSQVYKLDGGEI
jgi:hypothetical protein